MKAPILCICPNKKSLVPKIVAGYVKLGCVTYSSLHSVVKLCFLNISFNKTMTRTAVGASIDYRRYREMLLRWKLSSFLRRQLVSWKKYTCTIDQELVGCSAYRRRQTFCVYSPGKCMKWRHGCPLEIMTYKIENSTLSPYLLEEYVCQILSWSDFKR